MTTAAPKIMYRMTWWWPETPDNRYRALVDHAASMSLVWVLESRGATVERSPASVDPPAPVARRRPHTATTGPPGRTPNRPGRSP